MSLNVGGVRRGRAGVIAPAALLVWVAACTSADGGPRHPHDAGAADGGADARGVCTGGGTFAGGETTTLDAFCATLGASVCDRGEQCGLIDAAGRAECEDEVSSDCRRNGSERLGGGWAPEDGDACLADIREFCCESVPENCEGNLATGGCNFFLDGQTDGVDPSCP